VLLVAWLIASMVGGGTAETPTARPTSMATGFQGPVGTTAVPRPSTDPVSGLPWVGVANLPPEARGTLALIRAGGPFPYPRNDDQVFLNRERVLPAKPRGYYREFTVPTPGSDDRGARRIVTGDDGEKYWTDDHYQSFSRIREGT
jgi:ribonuclease T1